MSRKIAASLLALPLFFSISCANHPVERAIATESHDTHVEIPISEFVAQLKAQGQLDAFLKTVEVQFKQLVPDPVMRKLIQGQVLKAAKGRNPKDLDRLPVFPLRQTSKLRPALGAKAALAPATPPASEVLNAGALETYLGACDQPYEQPIVVNPQLPKLTWGHFANAQLSACAIDRSNKISRLLTALAADDGSSVSYAGKTLSTPRELIAALAANGHSVVLREERTFANFLSFNWGETEIRWPVWLDTGFKLKNGKALVAPMGHSQLTWEIEGPLVTARTSFYLGISGTGFFPATDQRPGWTGLKAAQLFNFADAPEKVLKPLDVAPVYYKRWLAESKTVAKGLPAGGYGYVGVCNDSVAFLTQAAGIAAPALSFPLMRARSVDKGAPLGDGLDDLIRATPHDSDDNLDRASTLKRVAAMLPYDPSEASRISVEFQALMQDLQAEIRD